MDLFKIQAYFVLIPLLIAVTAAMGAAMLASTRTGNIKMRTGEN